MSTLKNTYIENWKPISIEGLAVEESQCWPPITWRMAGRLKKKHAQKGDRSLAVLVYAKRANGEVVPETVQQCSNCGESTGYNKWTCRTSHS